MEFIIPLLFVMIFIFFMNATARKTQRQQNERREEAIVVGNNVVTTSGFFGRIVDIDGDAITLESPSGDETVWLRSAIMSQMDIPLATVDEDESYNADEEEEVASPLTSDSTSSDNQGSAWK
ncbi:preprotein translocase subunit YajC [Arcanobacterium haemolyticum]